uniref:Uncharacterized protein n=1 Tax=Anguilla anguilla TaxID=7936 RepID=A0A0E9R950_ANGAN
MNKSKQNFY